MSSRDLTDRSDTDPPPILTRSAKRYPIRQSRQDFSLYRLVFVCFIINRLFVIAKRELSIENNSFTFYAFIISVFRNLWMFLKFHHL